MTEAKKPDEQFRVTVAKGKYTVVMPVNGGLKALRYGEKWRDCCGDNLIYALACELIEARNAVKLSVEAKDKICKEAADEVARALKLESQRFPIYVRKQMERSASWVLNNAAAIIRAEIDKVLQL